MTDEQLLSMREAANVLGVSPATVRRRITTGEIPARKEERAQGFRWVIAAADLDVPAPNPDASGLRAHLAATEATSRELRHSVERLEADLERQTNLASQAIDMLQQERRHSHDLNHRLVQLLEVHPVQTPAALPEPAEQREPDQLVPSAGTPADGDPSTAKTVIAAGEPQDEVVDAEPAPTEQVVTSPQSPPVPRKPPFGLYDGFSGLLRMVRDAPTAHLGVALNDRATQQQLDRLLPAPAEDDGERRSWWRRVSRR